VDACQASHWCDDDDDDDDGAALKDAFSDLDYGNNGSVRAHDVGTALRAIGQTPTEADIHDLLQDAVLDGRYSVHIHSSTQLHFFRMPWI